MLCGFSYGGLHYRLEWVKCGRKSCRSCPHGPYWFVYDRSAAFLKKRYVGKRLPDEVNKWGAPDGLKNGQIQGKKRRTGGAEGTSHD